MHTKALYGPFFVPYYYAVSIALPIYYCFITYPLPTFYTFLPFLLTFNNYLDI